jgi:class 3 adenylate cyclase/tetratricopeptide (TPR) repeat protein
MAAATVSVVFTDLVGSTALLSRVGEERAEVLRREHFGLLRDAIATAGGTEVKNLGDGLMIVVASAADAVAGAVAIQQAFERRNRDASEPLLVRVGVASGDADVEDGDYFGVPVVEAARLCAKAEGGEILVTDVVRALAGSRGGFEFESVGSLELKGLDAPVGACRVVWMPRGVGDDLSVPLPGRIGAAVAAAFVGRAREREGLVEALRAVEAGARRVVLISGEPGIGKTSLSAGFARDAFAGGAAVLYGRCDEDLGIPYQPWAEALAHLVGHGPEAVLAAHVGARGGELVRLAPGLATRTELTVASSSDGESERYLLFGAVVDVLARVSALAPVVLLLDDLHWADRQTVQLLRHVVSAEAPLRLLVIGTFRESDVGTDHPLVEALAALHRESGVERLALRGLGDDELLTLMEATAGHEMTEEGVALRDALLAETAGNPFFVGEMLRHLAETQAIFQDDQGRWVASDDLRTSGLPVSIREVIGRRVARLGAQTQSVLSLAAVIGRDFDADVLARVANLDEDAVLDLCDAAVTAAVLTEADMAGRYTFAHALIEHTLYDDLSAGRRARAHRTIAEAIEELCGDDPGARIGELAYHWAAAVQPTDTSKAVHYAQIAGDRALDLLAPDEGVRWYSQALELLDRTPHPDTRQRAELLVDLGDAQRQCGNAAHRDNLLDAAHLADQHDHVDLLVRAVLANNRGYASAIGEVDHERIAAIDRALERVGDEPSADRARLLALAAAERTSLVDLPERLSLAEQAVAVARASGDRAALAWALQRPFTSLIHPSTLALRTAWIDEACEIADDLGEPAMQYWAHDCAFRAALERADGAALDEHLHRAEELAARIPHATIRWTLTYKQACIAGLHGDLAEYERLAETALTLGIETGQPDAMTIYAAQLANVRHHQGRMHELIPLIEQALADTPTLHVYRAVLALAHARAGEADQAQRLLDEEHAAGFPMPNDVQWSTGLVSWADTAVRVGAVDTAPLLRERLLSYHDHIVTTAATFSPAVCYDLGLLDHLSGRYDDAEQWFTEALQLHERVRSPLLVAITHAAWAALLADRNQHDDHTRARAMAQQALDTAIAGGYGYIETDARTVLSRLA